MGSTAGPGLVAVWAALAAAPQTDLPRGRLVENVRCQSDPSQTYTLYLPAGYRGARRWPALLVFDPRGRSVLAAELFREAAEEHGWIVLSSNDTRSDGPPDPNARALQALWPEVHLRYATDPRRIYAAGFSGGGMLAWHLGRVTGELAGVIATGARWDEEHFRQRVDIVGFGAAGDTDFNYAPMRAIHARLREWGAPERFEVFPGPHAWMPAELAGQAVAWMELQAMKSARRAVDAGFVADQLAKDIGRARSLEAEGRPLEARRRFESVAATFEGLGDVSEARREAGRLASLPATRAALEEEERWDRYEEGMRRRLDEAYSRLLHAEPPMLLPAFRSEVRLEELRRRAAAETYDGVVGRRLLRTLATQAGFYIARELLARRDHVRALAALAVATEAAPEQPYFWYNLGCVRARLGDKRAALDALEEAVAAGFSDRDHMAADEDLASLRGERRFQALLAPSSQGPPSE